MRKSIPIAIGISQTDCFDPRKVVIRYGCRRVSKRAWHQEANDNFLYDAGGRMIADISKGHYYAYGRNGLLKAVYEDSAHTQPVVRYKYDISGNRIEKRDFSLVLPKITSYIYSVAGQLVASIKRTDMGGNFVNKGAEFTLRGGSSIGVYQGASASDNQYLFHIKDHKGNVRNMISEAPDATDAYPEIHMVKDYYPFGMALPGRQFSGSIYQQSTSYGFDGKEEDGQFQLNHYPLREYDPRLARWTTPDPFNQFWSPYAALSNDPINRVDPSGGHDYLIDGIIPVSGYGASVLAASDNIQGMNSPEAYFNYNLSGGVDFLGTQNLYELYGDMVAKYVSETMAERVDSNLDRIVAASKETVRAEVAEQGRSVEFGDGYQRSYGSGGQIHATYGISQPGTSNGEAVSPVASARRIAGWNNSALKQFSATSSAQFGNALGAGQSMGRSVLSQDIDLGGVGIRVSMVSVYADPLIKNAADAALSYKPTYATRTTASELARRTWGEKALKGISKNGGKIGARLSFVGMGITIYDGSTNEKGWQNHHTADLAIQAGLLAASLLVPGVGWIAAAYLIADIAVQINTGKSITEKVFDD